MSRAPALPRVKQSCIPCRQRKSRCNEEIPCSSCLLRGTEADCQLPSASTSASTPKRKMSHEHLARTVSKSVPRSRKSSRPAEAFAPSSSPEPSQEDKDLWNRMLDTLPPRAACEILVEYLCNECDWLYNAGDILGVWERAIRRGALDRSTAGFLYTTLATPAALLGDHGSPLYRPNIAPGEHVKLISLAYACIPERPITMMDFDFIVSVVNYEIYVGAYPTSSRLFGSTLQAAIDAGLFDESLPVWADLNSEERNEWRRISWGLYTVYRWSVLAGRDAGRLGGLRFNICRPSMKPYSLNRPVSLPFPPRSHVPGDLMEERFRLLRIRSQAELDRVERYRHILTDVTDLIPKANAFVTKIGKVNTEFLLSESEALYREVDHWLNQILPAARFGPVPVEDIDTTDIVSCRYACQSLVLHLAINHIAANFLRYWLEYGDVNASSPSPQKRLYQACLDNARRTMDALPVVRALVNSRFGPFIVPFIAFNLFNAATAYAIPVLRAVRHWSSQDTTKDIALLPAWPETFDDSNRRAEATPSALGRLPPAIYRDSVVKECATNMLVILDALTVFNANPLGQTVAQRLNSLITQYGIRDVTKVQHVPPFDPASRPPQQPLVVPPRPLVSLSPLNETTSLLKTVEAPQPGAVPFQDVDPNDDMAFINSLLQMDGSVWEGLLEAGVLTGKDGNPLV